MAKDQNPNQIIKDPKYLINSLYIYITYKSCGIYDEYLKEQCHEIWTLEWRFGSHFEQSHSYPLICACSIMNSALFGKREMLKRETSKRERA